MIALESASHTQVDSTVVAAWVGAIGGAVAAIAAAIAAIQAFAAARESRRTVQAASEAERLRLLLAERISIKDRAFDLIEGIRRRQTGTVEWATQRTKLRWELDAGGYDAINRYLDRLAELIAIRIGVLSPIDQATTDAACDEGNWSLAHWTTTTELTIPSIDARIETRAIDWANDIWHRQAGSGSGASQ